jgi:hypothetical protein
MEGNTIGRKNRPPLSLGCRQPAVWMVFILRHLYKSGY